MRAPLHVAFFAIVGPAIAAHICYAFILIISLQVFGLHGASLAGIFGLWMRCMMYGYLLGLVPAILTGIFDYGFRQQGSYKKVVFFGGCASLIAAPFIFNSRSDGTNLVMSGVVAFAGALSALVCHLLMKRISPMPKLD
jgi:hypothetical protein